MIESLISLKKTK